MVNTTFTDFAQSGQNSFFCSGKCISSAVLVFVLSKAGMLSTVLMPLGKHGMQVSLEKSVFEQEEWWSPQLWKTLVGLGHFLADFRGVTTANPSGHIKHPCALLFAGNSCCAPWLLRHLEATALVSVLAACLNLISECLSIFSTVVTDNPKPSCEIFWHIWKERCHFCLMLS